MRRRAALVAIWVIGTLGSIALAWTAVSAVGRQVTDRPAGGLTAAEVADAVAAPTTTRNGPAGGSATSSPATTPGTGPSPGGRSPAPSTPPPTSPPATPTPTNTAAPGTTAPPASAPTSRKTFESEGGSVGVRCTGSTASLEFATPRAGYATEVNDSGPGKVDVRFEGEESESRVVVTCWAGTADAEIRDD